MVPFEEYAVIRGGGLVRLGYLLTGQEKAALDLAHEALARLRRGWSQLEADNDPDVVVRQELLRCYLSRWRRVPVAATHPLAALSRLERAVVVLRLFDDVALLQRRKLPPTPDPDTFREPLEHMLSGPLAGGVRLPDVAAARRRLARQRVLAVGAIVVVLGAGVAVRGATPPTPEPDPPPSARPPVRLVQANFDLPFFPFRVAGLPPAAKKVQMIKQGQDVGIRFDQAEIWVLADRPNLRGELRQVEVNGLAAEMNVERLLDQDEVSLTWRQGGRWLYLKSIGLPAEDALVLASSLAPGRVEMRDLDFTITLTPPNYIVQATDGSNLCLAASDPAYNGKGFSGLCVEVFDRPLDDRAWPQEQIPITVAGRPGTLYHFTWQSAMKVPLDDGRTLVLVHNPMTEETKLSDNDLIRIAEGIKVRPLGGEFR